MPHSQLLVMVGSHGFKRLVKRRTFALYENHHLCVTRGGIFFPQLVFNFLLNKMLKISIWHPSKCFALIITLFNLLQKTVNTLLLEYSIFSIPILPRMKCIYILLPMIYFAPKKPAFSYREALLEYFQQTLLQRNKKLQLTPH